MKTVYLLECYGSQFTALMTM